MLSGGGEDADGAGGGRAGRGQGEAEVFPVLDEDVTFDVGGRDLFEVVSDGSACSVNFVSDAGGAMAALLGLGVMNFDASKAEVRDGALCITSGKTSEPVSVAVPAGAGGHRPYVLLGHASGRRQVAALIAEPLGGGPLGPPRYIWLKGGSHQHESVLTLPEGPLQRLFVILGPHADMCLSKIEIGRLTDRG